MAERLGEALLDLRTSDQGLNSGIEKARKGAEGLGLAFDRTSGKATGMGAGMGAAARGAQQAGAANRLAAGSLGNLTAQFNDIGLMLAAGQNPLMLALQQGTQITQVIGPIGAAGAVKALGAAFMGMLNPVSLITIGSIAAGAAMIQWLFGAGEKARTLDDLVRDLDKSIKALREGSKRSLDDLRADFGAVTPEVLAMERAFQELRIREVLLDAAEASKAMSESMSGGFRSAGARLSDLFGADELGAITPAWDAVKGMNTALDMLGESTSLKDQVFWIDQLQGLIVGATGGIGGMSAEQREFYQKTLDVERALRAALGLTGDIARTDIAGGIRTAADEARRLADDLLAAVGAAQSLASQGQTALREAQLRFEFKDNPVKLAGELAALRFNSVTNGASPSSPEGMAIAALREEAVSAAVEVARLNEAYAEWQTRQRDASKASGEQRSALTGLIDAQMAELAILRESNPVQQEMLKHREALAGATEAERQMVEELIATRLRETEAMALAQETAAFFGDITLRTFDALIVKGDSLGDVLANVASALASAALQAAILGTGPLAGLFGSGPGTSLFGDGGLAEGLFSGFFAEGGLIPTGQFGIVGEAGPEPIIGTSRGAMVMPNSSLRRVEGGGGANVTVNIQTPDAQSFARSRGQVAAGIARAVAAGQRNL